MVGKLSPAERTEAGDRLTELILQIFRTNGRLLRIGDQLGRDLGLTAARWQVMGAIDERAKTVAQIAREFELTRQGVLWVVQALTKEGLVELIHNPDHRRAKLVSLTVKGREVYDEMINRQILWVNELGKQINAKKSSAALETISLLGRLTASDTTEPTP